MRNKQGCAAGVPTAFYIYINNILNEQDGFKTERNRYSTTALFTDAQELLGKAD